MDYSYDSCYTSSPRASRPADGRSCGHARTGPRASAAACREALGPLRAQTRRRSHASAEDTSRPAQSSASPGNAWAAPPKPSQRTAASVSASTAHCRWAPDRAGDRLGVDRGAALLESARLAGGSAQWCRPARRARRPPALRPGRRPARAPSGAPGPGAPGESSYAERMAVAAAGCAPTPRPVRPGRRTRRRRRALRRVLPAGPRPASSSPPQGLRTAVRRAAAMPASSRANGPLSARAAARRRVRPSWSSARASGEVRRAVVAGERRTGAPCTRARERSAPRR